MIFRCFVFFFKVNIQHFVKFQVLSRLADICTKRDGKEQIQLYFNKRTSPSAKI
jgi:hypothetical protein